KPKPEPLTIAGSRLVMRIGTATSKIAFRLLETGEPASTTAHFVPIVAVLSGFTPLPEKFPVTVLAEHGFPPVPGGLYCRVAATKRSVAPSLLNTVNGSEILATTSPW